MFSSDRGSFQTSRRRIVCWRDDTRRLLQLQALAALRCVQQRQASGRGALLVVAADLFHLFICSQKLRTLNRHKASRHCAAANAPSSLS